MYLIYYSFVLFIILSFVSGIILIVLPFCINAHKRKVFRNCKITEGRVIDIRNTVSRKNTMLICPEIEYDQNGKPQNAHHYYGIPRADFSVGDTITVLINPALPSVFRFENDKMPPKSNTIILCSIGIAAILTGMLMLVFFT